MLRIHLFKNGGADFINLLRESGIEFTPRPPPLRAIQASSEVVGIILPTGVALIQLARVLVAWLNARASREILVQTPQGVVHTKGMSFEETKEILKEASSLTVIQTLKD